MDPFLDRLSAAVRRALLGVLVDGLQPVLLAVHRRFVLIVDQQNVLGLFEVILLFDLTDRTATGRRSRMRLRMMLHGDGRCRVDARRAIGQSALMGFLRGRLAEIERAARCARVLLLHGVHRTDQLRVDVDRRCVRCLPRVRVVSRNLGQELGERLAGNGVDDLMTRLLLLLKRSMEDLEELAAVQPMRRRADLSRFLAIENVIDDLLVRTLIVGGDVDDLLVDLLGTAVVEDADGGDTRDLVQAPAELLPVQGEHVGNVLFFAQADDLFDGVVQATLALNRLAVGSEEDAFQALQTQVFGHFADAVNEPTLATGTFRVRLELLLLAILEALQREEQLDAQLV